MTKHFKPGDSITVDGITLNLVNDGKWIAKISKQQHKQWMNIGVDKCPLCLSSDITATSNDFDVNYAVSHCECNNCNATWDEVYYLKYVENIVPGVTIVNDH